MPTGTKVAKAEAELKKEAKKMGLKGDDADRYVYGRLNNTGLKKGNKTTKKGAVKV
jgi:hypothetical protein